MSSAIVTILGFDEWLKTQNKSLFDKLTLPKGIDKEILTDNILLKASEFEVIYSNPDFMVNAIGLWSKKHFKTFEKWQSALELEFNPIENYDRIEEWSDENTGTVTDKGTNTGTVKDEGTNTGTVKDEGTNTGTGTSSDTNSSVNTETVSAFDSDTYEPNRETSASATISNSVSNSGTSNNLRTDNLSSSNIRSENVSNSNIRTDNLRNKHFGRIHGNIGVTTSSALLSEYLDIAEWNIYEHITDLFIQEFCILIY